MKFVNTLPIGVGCIATSLILFIFSLFTYGTIDLAGVNLGTAFFGMSIYMWIGIWIIDRLDQLIENATGDLIESPRIFILLWPIAFAGLGTYLGILFILSLFGIYPKPPE